MSSATDLAAPTGSGDRRRVRPLWWIAGAAVVVVIGAVGTFTFFWLHSGAHGLAPSTAVQRFRLGERGEGGPEQPGPAQGVYRYRGSGSETVSVPPKTQSEGPVIPGTVIDRPGGCFEFRLDYSDVHWQDWSYCQRSGALVTTSKAGYYLWDFVVLRIDDTSTYTCQPAAVTIPATIVIGSRHAESCTGHNDHLSIGPVHMVGTSTVAAVSSFRVGATTERAVLIREAVTFSGGQQGSNSASTWFSEATGLPLRGTWSTVVSTPSPVGTSTLRAHGEFSLLSLTVER